MWSYAINLHKPRKIALNFLDLKHNIDLKLASKAFILIFLSPTNIIQNFKNMSFFYYSHEEKLLAAVRRANSAFSSTSGTPDHSPTSSRSYSSPISPLTPTWALPLLGWGYSNSHGSKYINHHS